MKSVLLTDNPAICNTVSLLRTPTTVIHLTLDALITLNLILEVPYVSESCPSECARRANPVLEIAYNYKSFLFAESCVSESPSLGALFAVLEVVYDSNEFPTRGRECYKNVL